jgi:hypothetical protein
MQVCFPVHNSLSSEAALYGFAFHLSPITFHHSPLCGMKTPSIIVGAILALEFFSWRIGACAALPDIVQCPLTVLHGRLYLRAALQGQPEPNWWLVDTGSPWSLVNAEQARRLTQSNPVIKEQIAKMGGRTLIVLKSIGINIAGQSMGPFDFFKYPSLGALDANRNSRVGYAVGGRGKLTQ